MGLAVSVNSSSSSSSHDPPIGSLTALRVKCGINFRTDVSRHQLALPFIIIDLLRHLDAENYCTKLYVQHSDNLLRSIGRSAGRKINRRCAEDDANASVAYIVNTVSDSMTSH